MAYKLEGKDLVIAGFEDGIADSPYSGAPDMRNVELISVPGEASVQERLAAAAKPPVLNAVAYTAAASTDRLTIPDASGLYTACAVVLASNTATGLSNSVVYYVQNIVGNTFQVSLAPAGGSVPINITADGGGTLTTYQYNGTNGPYSYWVDRTGVISGANSVLLTDNANRLWAILSATLVGVPANSLIFLGNIGVTTFTVRTGVVVWNGYILLLTFNGIDYADAGSLFVSSGPAVAWVYNWKTISPNAVNGRINLTVSQEDGNLYFISDSGLGSLIEQPGTSFDPTNASTYSLTSDALPIPATDESTYVAELGSNILIGGRNSFVYVWNKVDPGFSGLLNIPDIFTSFIVPASQNAYIFAGNRGRIYITNGSGIDLYKKVPDYVTGAIRPYIRWRDANFMHDQLIFSFTATTSAGTDLPNVAGVWGIDLESASLRMINKTTNTGYAGSVRMVCEKPPSSSGSPVGDVIGNSVMCGWADGSTASIDVPSTTPYSNYETYIHTELIPVGTYLDPFTASQFEWKVSAPLVAGEAVKLSYRTNISEAFTLIGEGNEAGSVSGYFQANFQKVQWAQFLIETKSTATNPSYTRVTEIRIRDFPSGKNSNAIPYGK